MEFLSEFGVAVVSAAILQNVVLTRGLGSCKRTLTLPVPRQILYLGGTLTAVTFLAALIAWPLNLLVRTYQSQMQLTLRYLTSITALISICLVFLLLYLGTRAWFPRIHYHLRELMVPASLNCAVLGSIIIALTSGYGVFQAAGYALGSGIGYTLALLLIWEGRRRLALTDVPRSFRGLPILLLYMGILSLAIYGLIGHQLPT